MRTKFALTLLLLAGVSTALSAQNWLTGEWNVKGTNPEGDAYEGALEIEADNRPLYKLQWEVDYEDEPNTQTFPGTALFDKERNVMYAAYGIGTLRYGLVSYPLNEKGGLQGSGNWTSHQGVGAELLAGKLNRRRLAGTYQVVGRRSKGDVEMGASETYEGTLKIKKDGDMYRLEWYLGDGTPYKGFAYKTENALVGAWGIGGSYGLEIYTFNEDRKGAESIWMTPNYGEGKGKEMITKR